MPRKPKRQRRASSQDLDKTGTEPNRGEKKKKEENIGEKSTSSVMKSHGNARGLSTSENSDSQVLTRSRSIAMLTEPEAKMTAELKSLIRQVELNLLSKMEEIDIKTEFKELQKSVGEMKESLDFINEEVEALKTAIPVAEEKMADKYCDLERQLSLAQAYSARENLVLVNVPEVVDDSGREDTKTVFLNFIEQKLGVATEDIEIQRVHRVHSKKPGPRPMKVRLLRYRDKEVILRNASKLKGTPPAVFEDLPPKIRAARKILLPKLKEAKRQGKKATFSRSEPDKLIIDGKVTVCDWKKL